MESPRCMARVTRSLGRIFTPPPPSIGDGCCRVGSDVCPPLGNRSPLFRHRRNAARARRLLYRDRPTVECPYHAKVSNSDSFVTSSLVLAAPSFANRKFLSRTKNTCFRLAHRRWQRLAVTEAFSLQRLCQVPRNANRKTATQYTETTYGTSIIWQEEDGNAKLPGGLCRFGSPNCRTGRVTKRQSKRSTVIRLAEFDLVSR